MAPTFWCVIIWRVQNRFKVTDWESCQLLIVPVNTIILLRFLYLYYHTFRRIKHSFKQCNETQRDYWLYNRAHNYVDYAADENGIWVMYMRPNEEKLIVSKIETVSWFSYWLVLDDKVN